MEPVRPPGLKGLAPTCAECTHPTPGDGALLRGFGLFRNYTIGILINNLDLLLSGSPSDEGMACAVPLRPGDVSGAPFFLRLRLRQQPMRI